MLTFFRSLIPKNFPPSKGDDMAKTQGKVKSISKDSDAHKESFQYQMDLLKMEIQSIDTVIARMDEMAQASKNWAITIWTGSIAFTLSQPDLRKFVIISAVTPILFWYMDAYFRRLQTRSIFRVNKIREFLNSDKLVSSFEKNRLVDFIVYDTTGTQYKGGEEYKKFTSIRRTLNYPEVRDFYFILIFISTAIGLYFLLTL